MKGNRLYKSEKLCGRTAVSMLFSAGRSVSAFPLRAVIRMEKSAGDRRQARFMITVPKDKEGGGTGVASPTGEGGI